MSALDLLASLVLDDGRRWGDVAAPWQWDDAAAVLEPGDGPALHFLTRPRGGSKTTDLAGIAAAVLVEQLPPGGRAYALAADRDQARLVVDALGGLVTRTPGLASAITVDRYAASTPSGARLEVVPADAASSYGLRAHLLIVDELTVWPAANREVWTSVLSAAPKVRGCRLVVVGSSGDPAHWSYRVREHARQSRAWRLHEVPGPVPWIAPEALAEQRALLTDSQYARLHLNIWSASEDRLVSVENLAAAVTLGGPQPYHGRVTYRIGVDLGLRHDATAIAVAHAERAGDDGKARRVVLDRMVTFAGTREREVNLGEVEAAIVECWHTYGRPRVRLTPWQAVGLAQRLRRQGIAVEEWSYSARRYGALTSLLYALLRDGLLDLYDAPGLVDELANIRLTETSVPGVLRVTHDAEHHDDMTTALGMAALALVERSGTGPLALQVPVGRIPTRADRTGAQQPPTVVPAGEPRPDPSGGWHPRRAGRRPAAYTPPRKRWQ